MKRTKEEAEQTKEEIFQAGLRVFSQKGFAAATIGDIARESNYTRGAIYWHFESKDAIFFELYERVSKGILSVIKKTLNNDIPFVQNIRNILETILFRMMDDDEWKMMNELLIPPSEVKKIITLDIAHHAKLYELVAPLVQTAIDKREIRRFSSPRIVYNLISVFIFGIIEHITKNLINSKDEIQEIIDVLIRCISTNYT